MPKSSSGNCDNAIEFNGLGKITGARRVRETETATAEHKRRAVPTLGGVKQVKRKFTLRFDQTKESWVLKHDDTEKVLRTFKSKEEGSRASYADVLKVLLTHEIAVYGIGVDSAAIPGYGTVSKLHLPFTAFGNLLPKYVSATGGEYFAEFTRNAIEQTYSRLTEVARNQYTLGYTTRATVAGNYRTIEVRVKRPGLRVYAKDGYYPLPPQRANP